MKETGTVYTNADDFFAALDRNRNWLERWMNDKMPGGIGGMNPYYALKPWHWWKTVSHYIFQIRRRWTRGKKGWHYSDTYSLDWYLLSWLPDAVAYLRDNSISYPGGDITPEKWDDILTNIEEGLRHGKEYADCYKDCDELKESFEESWALMGKYFFHLWD